MEYRDLVHHIYISRMGNDHDDLYNLSEQLCGKRICRTSCSIFDEPGASSARDCIHGPCSQEDLLQSPALIGMPCTRKRFPGLPLPGKSLTREGICT